MAISLISSPQDLTPAFNQMIWTFDSTNKNVLGFRYKVDIYDEDNNLIITKRIAPEPNFGYGYTDISKIIGNELEHNVDFNSNYRQEPTKSFNYDLVISEDYLYTWDFIGITWSVGDPFWTLIGTTPSVWNLNNGITIDVDFGDNWSNGNHTVLDSPGNDTRVLGEYGGTGTASGTVYWSNRTRTSNFGGTYSGTAFIGVFDTVDFFSYNENIYSIPSTGISSVRSFLTNIPDNFYITETQDIWLLLAKDLSDTNGLSASFVNSNGDEFSAPAWVSGGTVSTTSINTSPDRIGLTLISGTAPLVKPTTEWYDVYLRSATTTPLTKKVRFWIDRRCKIEDYEILFVDRLGSWSSFAFQLRSKESGTIERKSYNKVLGTIDAVNGWTFQRSDAGQTNYDITFDKELELNTNWMTDEMSVYFEELLTSPVTYLKDSDGIYKSVQILDNGFQTERQRNKILIKKSIKVRFSLKNKTNI